MAEFIHLFISILYNWSIVVFSIGVIYIPPQNLLRLIDM